MQLKDKVIIITGGCQGLGRAMAEYLAAKGAKLALVDLNPEKLELAVAACQAHGVEARAYLCNVADEEQVTQTVNQIAEDFRAINGLVNNAGILRDGLLLKVKDGVMTKMSLAQWQAVIDVNLTGVFLCTREVAAKMIELNSQGAIINISSISRAGNVGQTNYSAAKAGMHGFSMALAQEVASKGVTVNTVSPGYIGTDMVKAIRPEVLEKIVGSVPVKRLGEPSEIASIISWLSSTEGGYATGADFSVNGGLHMH